MNAGRPYALLFSIEHWDACSDRVLPALGEFTSPRVRARMRWGTLLPTSQAITSATYSEYTKHSGRRLLTRTQQASVIMERRIRTHLAGTLESVAGSRLFESWTELRADLESFSFSALTVEQAQAARDVATGISADILLAAFNPADRIHRILLWSSLPLGAVISDGTLLRPLEDEPSGYAAAANGRTVIVIPSGMRHRESESSSTGFFEESFGAGELLVEERFAALFLPPELSPAPGSSSPQVPELRRTPAQQALDRIPFSGVTRISSRDQPSSEASVVLPAVHHQFPDVERVHAKVRDYCLARSQPEQKWIGFAQLGFDADRPGDSWLLACLLCSALYPPFIPLEIRATADGAVQFSVEVLLSRRFGGFGSVLTSWYFTREVGVFLSTAYVHAGVASELAAPLGVLGMGVDGEDWATLFDHCAERSLRYGASVSSSPLLGKGWLWISHADPRSAAFARWARSSVGPGSGGIFSRRSYGGRVTQVSAPIGISDYTRVVGSLRYLQLLLGIAGVQTYVETHLD